MYSEHEIRKFWTDVYVAAVSSGRNAEEAKDLADKSVKYISEEEE